METTLCATGENFISVVNACSDVMVVCRFDDGGCLAVNESFTALTGYATAEVAAEGAGSWISAEDWQGLCAEIQQAGQANGLTIALRTKAGAARMVQASARRIEFDGAPSLLVIAHELNPSQKTGAALRESERFNPATLNVLTEHIAILDETGIILHVNQAWRTFARENGLALPDAGVGVNYLAVCDAVQGKGAGAAADFAQGIRAVMRGERDLYEQEYDCHAPQERRWFIGRATRFQEQGPVRIIVTHNSITAHMQTEEALLKSEARFRQVVASIPEHIYVSEIRGEGQIVNIYQSSWLEKLTGYPQERFMNDWTFWLGTVVHPADREAAQAHIAQLLSGQTSASEYRLLRIDGNVIWVHDSARVETNPVGVKTIYGVVIDINARKQAEEALRESEERWRSFVSASPDYIALHDQEGKYLFLNHYAESFTEQEVIGSSLYQYISPGSVEIFRKNMEAALATGTTQRFEFTGLGDKAAVRMYEQYLVPMTSRKQEINILAVARDITEHKRAEEALQASEKKYRDLVELTHDLVWELDTEGRITYMSPASRRIYGREPEEMIGRLYTDFVPPDETHRWMDELARILATVDSTVEFENRIYHQDGHEIVLLANAVVLRDAAGNILGTVGTSSDITERKRTEARIAYQANLLAQVNDAIVASDKQYQLTAWNLAAEAIYGWKAEEVLGYDGREILHTEWESTDPEEMRLMIAKMGRWHGEATQARKDGTRIPVEISTLVLRDDGGQITGNVSVNRDITERKRAEGEIQSLAKFPAENPYPILRIGRDGTLLYINVAGSSQLPDWHLHVGQTVPPMLKEAVVKAMKNGTMQLIDLEYNEQVYSFSVAPIVATDYANLYGLDITERKRAEDTRRESEERFIKAFRSIPDALVISRLEDGKIIEVNDRWHKVFGYSREEVIGKSSLALNLFADSDDRQRAVSLLREQGFVRDFELQIRQKSGALRTAILSIERQEIHGEQYLLSIVQDVTERRQAEVNLAYQANLLANVSDAVTASDIRFILTAWNRAAENMFGWKSEEVLGRPGQEVFRSEFIDIDRPEVIRRVKKTGQFHGEIIQYRKDGTSIYVEASTFAMKNESGQTTGYVTISRDITERKRVEEELAQSHEQLRALTLYWQTAIEAERARIAREIHDDFGQSMTALKMDLRWLAKRLPEGDVRVERIRGMTALVDESIALMRRIASSLRPNLLDDLGLNAALEWQAQEFSRHSGLPCHLNLPKDELALDPALSTTLFRIFQETLTNVARHAQATRVNVSLQQKEHTLILTMRDNGRGIPEAEINKPRSLGLLGLRERAALWGGETTIRGVAGEGTTVTVRIPLPASPLNGGKR